MTTGSGYSRRVRVESWDGFNFVGTVVREYREQGQRVVLVEDNRGQRRAVRPDRPEVEIHDLDDTAGGGRR